jgi:deferrochelatase/peroxidase EfeB
MLSPKEPLGESPSTHAPTLDLQEIQATVLRQRPAPHFGTHGLWRVDDAQAGRHFLCRLTPHIASAANWWNAANTWLTVGISYAGLDALGVPQDSLQSFPEAFREGKGGHARQLGDIGANNPRKWDLPKSRSWLVVAGTAKRLTRKDRP